MSEMFNYVVFLYQVARSMIDGRFSHGFFNDLLRFRIAFAHDIRYADVMTRESLIQRICAKDSTLHSASTQAALYKDQEKLLEKAPVRSICGRCV